MTVTSVFVSLVISAAAAQTPPATPLPKGSVMLDGCISASQTVKNAFTLDDDEGRTYLLKGVNVRDLVGKRVEVIGAPPKRLSIVGGLYPSPNVAAQAGGIDPVKAAIASQAGPTSQTERPPIEITVKSVRVLPGPCAETPK